MSERFDFSVANALSQSVLMAADTLDVKNGQMVKRFNNLSEYFKDSRYDEYSLDMEKAEQSVDEVVSQMKRVAKSVADYAEQLRSVQ